MYFDRFDIVSAHYAFYSDYHDGQWGRMYKRLSKICRYFVPGLGDCEFPTLNENSQEIYRNLEKKYGFPQTEKTATE